MASKFAEQKEKVTIGRKLDRFSAAVNEAIDRQVDSEIKDVKAQAEALIRKVKDESELQSHTRLTEQTALLENSYRKLESNAFHALKKDLLKHRQTLTNRLAGDIRSRLEEFTQSEMYFGHLVTLINPDLLDDGVCTVSLSEKDFRLYGEALAEKIKELFGILPAVESDSAIRIGGLSLYNKNKNILDDRTFDDALDRQLSLGALLSAEPEVTADTSPILSEDSDIPAENTVSAVNGPIVKVANTKNFSMLEMVYVGNKRLTGEVIGISEEFTTIQVYETTTGLKVGEPVRGTGEPLCVTLGPGIMSGIFDGIERPLKKLEEMQGAFIAEGSGDITLDTELEYDVTVKVKAGEYLTGGQVYATCPETPVITHCCLVPPNVSGEAVHVCEDGKHRINDAIITLKLEDGTHKVLTLCHKWPIRQPRPVTKRLEITRPLITGQRVIDSILPIAKGGTASIPGGFGTGKTMTQHQLAKWCDADIIVYIGCGERGNEMTQVLTEFAELIDPKTNRPLTDRTVLIANTSNMPVAAREASIYTGITLAEYYRDMGYHIAIMADSTSRWAEALREISGRLEEMPAEEGFPAYLPSRLSEFYERAGYAETLSGSEGSVTIIGAVSPQGADFSEPVTQNTKRFVRCFWALDKSLAYARHYPAINWITSYSEYTDDLAQFYAENVSKDFLSVRKTISGLLAEEEKLMEIVKLIGADVLPESQKLVIEIARVIRVGFLQQNAYHKDDTYVSLEKQYLMMDLIVCLYRQCKAAVDNRVLIKKLLDSGIFEKVIKVKYDIGNDELNKFKEYKEEIVNLVNGFVNGQ